MQLDVKALGGTQIAVGLSQLVPIIVSDRQIATSMKIVSGAGTLWIAPIRGVSLTGATAAALVTLGYPLSANEVFNIGGPAQFYLSAAAATMVVGMAIGYTSGYTQIV